MRTASSALIDGHWGPEGRKWVNTPLSMTFFFYLDITRLREEGKRDDTALAGKRLVLVVFCLGTVLVHRLHFRQPTLPHVDPSVSITHAPRDGGCDWLSR